MENKFLVLIILVGCVLTFCTAMSGDGCLLYDDYRGFNWHHTRDISIYIKGTSFFHSFIFAFSLPVQPVNS